MYETESLACKFIHQSPIKLLAHLPILYKPSATSSTEHPKITYGLPRQLKKTVPSVFSQTQEGVHKTPECPVSFLGEAGTMEAEFKSNIQTYIPPPSQYIPSKSTLSVFEHFES